MLLSGGIALGRPCLLSREYRAPGLRDEPICFANYVRILGRRAFCMSSEGMRNVSLIEWDIKEHKIKEMSGGLVLFTALLL